MLLLLILRKFATDWQSGIWEQHPTMPLSWKHPRRMLFNKYAQQKKHHQMVENWKAGQYREKKPWSSNKNNAVFYNMINAYKRPDTIFNAIEDNTNVCSYHLQVVYRYLIYSHGVFLHFVFIRFLFLDLILKYSAWIQGRQLIYANSWTILKNSRHFTEHYYIYISRWFSFTMISMIGDLFEYCEYQFYAFNSIKPVMLLRTCV